MRISHIAPVLFLTVHSLWAQKIELTVLDEISQEPVFEAEAHAIYDNPLSPNRYDEQTELSDENGEVQFFGVGKLGASLRVSKDGYYGFGVQNAEDFRFPSGELNGGVEKTIMLRPVIKPIALHAKLTQPRRHAPDAETRIPVLGEWCGYDFEIGDWVSPHGNGKVTDVLIFFDREFVRFDASGWQQTLEQRREFSKKAYAVRGEEWTEEKFRLKSGLWNLVFKVAFPNEKEGIILVEDGFNEHSVLRMPHMAYEEGYVSEYGYQITSNEYLKRRDDIGFFLRTRVVLDRQGNIESANYAKIYEDFKVTIDGKIEFAYYFNVTPNDRNLEFDPKQNLFPESEPGTFNLVLP